MIVTEEEAKTKRCQESFGDNNVSPAGFMVPSRTTMAMHTSPSYCIASGCMAWRWVESDPALRGRSYERGEAVRGYCGKAGVP